MSEVRNVPRVKLWRGYEGDEIVLECVCGIAVDYPGHPEEWAETQCPVCARVYRVVGSADVPSYEDEL